MSQPSVSEGTKIAQAAKDLNVTSVTIRRYIIEFDIPTTQDDNGIKVLPAQAMEELHEIRRLKEEGASNPRVMEVLEEKRGQSGGSEKAKPKARPKATRITQTKDDAADESVAEEGEETETRVISKQSDAEGDEHDEEAGEGDMAASGKAKHTLTCQTCGKTFEHMNPRLRDCLDCYRTKRKERRRGGSERHKTVIQHPLAQQAASKAPGAQIAAATPTVEEVVQAPLPVIRHTGVRNYRKAIEDTRHITANLKRRLERPDLLEGERRWLEQIYAYQLILHQGWRHLAEYRAMGQQQSKSE
jgi:DNA-binding transcriptional MerR regulator